MRFIFSMLATLSLTSTLHAAGCGGSFNGFVNDLIREFPMEYSVELKRLIDLEMEGSVG